MGYDWIQIVGYAACVANIAGNLMLAKLNVWGWIVRLITNVLWVVYALSIEGGGPMWANHAVFFAINVYGFAEWRKRE